MDFLISSAYAQTAAPAAAPNPLMSFLPLIILFGIFYFMLIRPQMKRAKEQKSMIAALAKGDEVLTNGGLLGRIEDIADQFVTLARDAFPSRPEDDPELTESELEGSSDAQLQAAFEAVEAVPVSP